MYYTYVLYSAVLDSYYKGCTADLVDRLSRHNAAQELATRNGVPWRLIWYAQKPNRSEAYQLEQKLKNLNRKRLLAFMSKYDQFYVGRDCHPEN